MEKNHHEKDYWELLDDLNHCDKGSSTDKYDHPLWL